ncbi:MFS transporter [Rhodococcus maanshanensis]|uniref:Predicted arabinose efflux permease, MFS family n=1 Tax=Rhodococcus maanshanensis TaxID=183556 RepID=A0A1H7XB22_9NOCA|nr:MFS transporter [Rhodococcus maanshanensis]SEM30814.1 Predicted arabinose efflux permease, MFS family [Rhodococcus maanshanensis]
MTETPSGPGTLALLRSFPRSVQLLVLNQYGVNTGFYMLVPYLSMHLTGNLGLTLTVTGLVLGVRTLGQQGLFLIGGTAADRLGPHRVIIAGCALRSVGFAVFAFGTSVPLLLLASVLSGLAGALFNPAVRSYIAVAEPTRRAEAFATFNVFAQAGALSGPLIGSALLAVDFRTVAIAAAALFAALTLAQLRFLPAHAVEPSTTTVLRGWGVVLANRRFVLFTVAMLGMFVLQTQMYLVYPALAGRITGWQGAVAVLFLSTTIFSLLFQVRLTRWFDARTSRGAAITTGLALMGGAFVLLLPVLLVDPGHTAGQVALAMAPLVVSALILESGIMIAQPFVMELIPAYGDSRMSGTLFGMFYLVSGIAAAGGNALIGYGIELGNGWPGALVCIALAAASAAGVWLLQRRGLLADPAGVKA